MEPFQTKAEDDAADNTPGKVEILEAFEEIKEYLDVDQELIDLDSHIRIYKTLNKLRDVKNNNEVLQTLIKQGPLFL